MQEELIEEVINIEKQAKELKNSTVKEIEELEEKYQQRMDKEKKLKLAKAKQDGQELVEKKQSNAEKFADNLTEESKKEIKAIESDYQKIKDDLLNDFFKRIISSGR